MKEKYYICNVCGKGFEKFCHLTKHKERKYPCKPDYFRLLEESRENYEHTKKNTRTITRNEKKIRQNYADVEIEGLDNGNEDKKVCNLSLNSYSCEYCSAIFNNEKSLLRHHNELRCVKIPFELAKKIIRKTKNKISHKNFKKMCKKNNVDANNIIGNNITNNTTNNNTTNNNTTNNNNNSVNTNTNINGNMINSNNVINNNNNNNNMIQVNPFGKEDIDFITDIEKLGIINSCCMAVPNMIKKTHSNDKNHNFYLRNINRKEIKFLNDKYQMEICDYDEFCNRLIDNNIDRVSDIYDEHKDKMSPRTREKMKKIINENYRGLHYDHYIKILRFPIINMTNDMKNDILKLEKMIKEGKVFPPPIEEKNNIKPICSKS